VNLAAASSLVIVLAIVFANLPFLNERCFAVLSWRAEKPLWFRAIELIVWFFCLGGFAFLLESLSGNRFPQEWQFYAINGCVFIVLSFPGFVYRYLKKSHA